MTAGRHPAPGRVGPHRCGLLPARHSAARLLSGVLIAGAAACSSSTAVPGGAQAPRAGAYAIATPGPLVLATPQASDGRYQLVAAGTPVAVTIGASTGLAVMSGPDLAVPAGPPATHAHGAITMTVTADRGSLPVAAADFLVLDQAQNPVALTASTSVGAAQPGAPAMLRLSADFHVGHATLTWQPTGRPLVTWDFVVEID